jgi:hypothetical protein
VRRTAAAVLLALSACQLADPHIVATTHLADTPDPDGPYQVHTAITGLQTGDQVEVFYSIDTSDPQRFIPRPMLAVDRDGTSPELHVATIPGQPPGSVIRYYVAVSRDDERVAADPTGGDLRPFSFQIAAAPP